MYLHEVILGLINLAMAALTFMVRAAMRRYEQTHCQARAKKAPSTAQPPETLDRELSKERDYAD